MKCEQKLGKTTCICIKDMLKFTFYRLKENKLKIFRWKLLHYEKSREIRMRVHCVLKYPNVGDSVRERTGKREISGILSFVREIPAQNGRVGRYE
jgi:hypothetical protein